MLRSSALALAVCAVGPAAAQSVWLSEDDAVPIRDYLECAVLAERAETVPGNAPIWDGAEVDFLRVAEEMYNQAAVAHGANLAFHMVEDWHREWGGLDNTAESRARLAATMQNCLVLYQRHFGSEDHDLPRISRQELRRSAG